MPSNLERDLTTKVCKYLKTLNVPFHVDAGDSKRRSFAEQNMLKKQQLAPGFPDLSIFHRSDYYGGLFLELKNGYSKLYYADGRWKTGDNDYHLLQYAFHIKLIESGYYACFVYDYTGAISIIDAYFKNSLLVKQKPIWGKESQWDKADKDADEFFRKYT